MTTSAAKPPTVKRATAAEAGERVEVSAVSRREFLYYAWAASIVMTLGACGGLLLWFAYPRFREGEFGGNFTLGAGDIPEKNTGPNANPGGRFWVSYSDTGLIALYRVCTHLGCLYAWVDANHRFECPCHGSKFTLDGIYIAGPAPRGPDRFEISVTLNDDTELAANEFGIIDLQENQVEQVRELVVRTGSKIRGLPHGVNYDNA